MQHIINAIKMERARRLYVDQGLSAAEVARQVEITPKTMGAWIKANNWKNTFEGAYKPGAIREAARLFIHEGLTAADIAAKVYASEKTVGRWIKLYNWDKAREFEVSKRVDVLERQEAARGVIMGFVKFIAATSAFQGKKLEKQLEIYVNQLK